MELDALLTRIAALAAEGDRERYDTDDLYRWSLHRLWIAVGNEAGLLQQYLMERYPQRRERTWRGYYLMRNALAHSRIPDIDEDTVWRMTIMRAASLRQRLAELPF